MAPDWKRLGEKLVQARVRLGHPKRAPFARALSLSDDRTLADLENARRTNYLPSTIAQAEVWYDLQPGNIEEILNGGDPRYRTAVGGEGQSQRPMLNLPEELARGMNSEQISELEARLAAEGWRARREIMGG